MPDFQRPAGGTIKSYWQDMLAIFESERYKKIATRHVQYVKIEFLKKPRTELLNEIIETTSTRIPPWHKLAKCSFSWKRICNSLGAPDPMELLAT